ncbi:TPA: Asp-tRNA(Asn)/Glu-tRNA(Gln) amidotransferase subunit GatB [Candidatus Beckwithbacteria bacterium]|nr:Asp-tRNA(Asn)/Glu-tRNA(Gln) amidotransferase subunit GatB [Candidatus Beckwithbacteria bacterium]HAV66950.1 Asp-tRNA(Asn)/Glu-tRNA(Gln) amidotransferase subunit GatB [Candidatus Beckwithbacteria bacterium]HBU21638.1 Asp-tRNA(Asn)/Glu-tRNA(Gln) amidotransferase subunit GatB [Candidatus Beckwithbacteria bacterium]HCE99749.1 Asp-tRNA(Asn)/Glu-tRNA(Gln) amidotransferase subunit GatB [Candidatus Beckwithbacteria bacterium]HCQ93172.1 Asp-tRNA(Asn)/Glu-tRNA(Gln) amidotransferase subunit GatB [Candi
MKALVFFMDKTKSKINVSHLAELSKMTVSPNEAAGFKTGFEATLKTVDKLEQLNTKKVGSTFQVTGLKNVYRPDKVDKSRVLSQQKALVNAKNSHKGYFVVPAIFDET